ncbi:unnamed protein product [Paramecium sonneborni]|uniref:Uncharacterized protein n=1 Tax=Paramecium sonneborni TaxID=65129 RepID=A0A8S1RAT8_9CILI|nr:unnamed protein product [Paramecium sonneborni]
MKHFSYLSEDIYTYENLVELKRILEFDGFGVSKIIEEDQCIQYSINREKCIRLSDLVYFISFKLVRIHLGQLLVLLKSLAEKVKQLQQANIEHHYLDCNRIWLKFNDQEQVFKIYYETQNYTIHFTGYQCPNYEDFDEQNLSMKSSQKILIIIKYIIDNYFDKVILQENKNVVKKNIIDQLYYGIHNKDLDKLINEIDKIYQRIINLIKIDKSYLLMNMLNLQNTKDMKGKYTMRMTQKKL